MTATEPTLSVEESALLRAILTHPADDTARLVYADWLQEQGQEERAEFIRVQCRIAAIARDLQSDEDCGQPGCAECDERRLLRRRERELLANLCRWMYGAVTPNGAYRLQGDNDALPADAVRLEFRRGFIESVTCTAADWLRHADALAWHPGQTVECRWCRRGEGLYGEECPECGATGRIPRPVPATAQPVTRVVLTTLPAHGDEWAWVCRTLSHIPYGGDGHRITARETWAEALRVAWPGIEFSLPDYGPSGLRPWAEGPDEGRMN